MPLASQVVLMFVAPEAKTFAANFAGSYGYATVVPTSSAVYTVNYDGGAIGTITIAVTTGAFTFATTAGSTEAIAAGHYVTVVAPASQDATLSGVSMTLVAS
jgi:hypothetical protein